MTYRARCAGRKGKCGGRWFKSPNFSDPPNKWCRSWSDYKKKDRELKDVLDTLNDSWWVI